MAGNDNRSPAILKLILLVLVLVFVLSVGTVPARAAATTFTLNNTQEIDLFVYVPCALGGMGEFVELSGPLHSLFTVTLDGNGGYTNKYLIQPQGITDGQLPVRSRSSRSDQGRTEGCGQIRTRQSLQGNGRDR